MEEETVNKEKLIKSLSEAGDYTKTQARVFIDTLTDVAENELRQRGVFAIHDLVEIKAVDKPARSGVAMGKAWSKPAHRALKAKIIGRAKRMFEAGS
jgi:nucleoid DNA-binding protein